MAWKPKIFTIWTFKEKLANLGLEDEWEEDSPGQIKIALVIQKWSADSVT